MYDVIIIGAGVSGCACAREISRYQIKACVIEKDEDVCSGTSKANSGIVHAGYDAPLGSLMAELNVQGNEMMGALAKELDFPFQRNGSLVVCFHEEELPNLYDLYEKGLKNNVKELQILNKKELRLKEPNISENAVAALFAPSGGIVCPFELNIALAENAYTNGVEFKFNTKVRNIFKKNDRWAVETNRGMIETQYVVNAAGVYADLFHNKVSEKKIHITPRRGEYCLMDKTEGGTVKSTIFQLPNQYGKGVLVTPTVHGNLLVGPTAIDIDDKEGTDTTREGLERLLNQAGKSVNHLSGRKIITSFAGLRAHEEKHEFIIEEVKDAKGFIDVAGIESPGLSSSPAIGVRVADILKSEMNLKPNPDYIGHRKGILDPQKLSKDVRNELIKNNPSYGTIICRCEMITEGEIIDAIRRPLGARTLDGIKRRTRAGMGRCQAGFCMPKTMEILARELKESSLQITKNRNESIILTNRNKEQA
ncbi:NAD(P)/FAD-dependent oxidoreductase [Anaerosacchariphilus polymeriproducens]|uniref:FAD/NAD(P)-binding oxidoreductase n=1 Tax=Anaerosacchariphilus polymeriproducens TaxID=1812858 RepID=A0A371AXM4_9FIRM|nr:NAD(P)/FAD-dependent oxidoreductase [Anaerosacchariphilus polymeriproducens]RDU24309.1 FAD/NAD(P)-binding oxidoreductase [Anaerosacchariphilus polymeriproducens]